MYIYINDSHYTMQPLQIYLEKVHNNFFTNPVSSWNKNIQNMLL